MKALAVCWAFPAVLLLTSCASNRIPEEALQLAPESMALRQSQTRRFETVDERKLLISAAGVLQDLGYTVEESETPLGVIVASKDREATETGQVVGKIFLAALFGVAVPVDRVQKIRAALITRPSSTHSGSTLLRVTFQRVVWDDRGQISKREAIEKTEIYEKFFQALKKAVFLEGHQI